jgi:hypothetical protein
MSLDEAYMHSLGLNFGTLSKMLTAWSGPQPGLISEFEDPSEFEDLLEIAGV